MQSITEPESLCSLHRRNTDPTSCWQNNQCKGKRTSRRKNTNSKYAKRNADLRAEDSVSRTALVSLVSRVPLGHEGLARSSWAPNSHQLRPEAVDDGTQGQATPPGRGQVCDVDMLVALGLLLAPG